PGRDGPVLVDGLERAFDVEEQRAPIERDARETRRRLRLVNLLERERVLRRRWSWRGRRRRRRGRGRDRHRGGRRAAARYTRQKKQDLVHGFAAGVSTNLISRIASLNRTPISASLLSVSTSCFVMSSMRAAISPSRVVSFARSASAALFCWIARR